MQLGTPQVNKRRARDEMPSAESGPEQDVATRTPGAPGSLSAAEQESLILNLEASLRVHARPHFFTWTQGLLQSLVAHEVLICALRNGEALSLTVDSLAMNAADPAVFSDAFVQDASVAPVLVTAWEERHFRPVVCEASELSTLAGGVFVQELQRINATRLVAHGTHDSDGRMQSFFVFACVPGTDPNRQAHLAHLLVPFLHSAWIRARLNGGDRGAAAAKPARTGNITAREQEILKWIYLGKSNFEIGAILDISPLTVKNHVQKILRKLNVVNRAQAVGKALELRVLRP